MRLNRIVVVAALSGCALLFAGSPAQAGSELKFRTSAELKENSKVVEPEEKAWSITVDAGYESKYIFRGTNLAPHSDGILYQSVRGTAYGFTLGATVIEQLGTAYADGTDSIGEGGGNTTVTQQINKDTNNIGRDRAVQTSFTEVDLLASYTHSFGPVDLTFGNILFLIYRSAYDHFTDEHPFPTDSTGDYQSIGDEVFDRLFLSVSTSVVPHITPSLTYYQTVYSHGDDPNGERNSSLGGYLEAKVVGSFPVIGETVSLDPYALVSVSFKDRTKESGDPLTGFNHFQAGLLVPIRLCKYVTLTGDINVSQRLSSAPSGTKDTEVWGGGKFSLTF